MTDNVKAIKEITVSSAAMASSSSQPTRLGSIEGYDGKRNDIIYHASKQQSANGCVVFFGGDMQDYKENMLAHRDNKLYADWDLESTAAILHNRFPEQAIAIIKPSKMALKTFSCYENFVSVNNFGAPSYEENSNSLKHLRLLFKNCEPVIKQHSKTGESEDNLFLKLLEVPITLVGFSKGCVVLNQILYSFHSLHKNPDNELDVFKCNIKHMYWLEGGHSGVSETWITNKSVLQSFSNLSIAVQIHVTPYQVLCDTRPRIGKEEKIFRDTLSKMDMDVTRKLHFESEPRSLEKHFQVLLNF